MIENVIARRYAKALAQAAVEKNELDRTSAELNLLADMVDPWRGDISVPELTELLGSPTVPVEEKIRITDVICTRMKMGQLISDFLNVLILHGRVGLTGRIAREFGRVTERLESIATAEVETAAALSDSERAMLQGALTKQAGKPVRLVVSTNSKLLAGLRVKIGDILYEGSLRGRLERMSRKLR